jgi:hypothetical protein
MERKSSAAAAMSVQIKPSEGACAGGTGQFLQPIKDALINLFYLNQNQRRLPQLNHSSVCFSRAKK